MNKTLRKFFLVLVLVYAIFCGVSYAIVTLTPVVACLYLLVSAACASKDPVIIAIAVFVVPLFLALIASPFIHHYLETKRANKTGK